MIFSLEESVTYDQSAMHFKDFQADSVLKTAIL